MKYNFHHGTLSVRELQRSIKFYELLNFHEIFDWKAEDRSLQITHMKNGPFVLELFCYAVFVEPPDSIHSIDTDLPVIGTKHIALQVDDIIEARTDLIQKKVIDDTVQITQGRTGITYFFVPDPDGILVEIVEDKRGL